MTIIMGQKKKERDGMKKERKGEEKK